MWTGKWELVVVWECGDKDVFEYSSEEKAQSGAKTYKWAFGNQVQWCGVRKQLSK